MSGTHTLGIEFGTIHDGKTVPSIATTRTFQDARKAKRSRYLQNRTYRITWNQADAGSRTRMALPINHGKKQHLHDLRCKKATHRNHG